MLLVVPFLGIAYLVAAPTTLRRRLLHSLGAVAAMIVTAGSWVAIVELVPANLRPYIGGSQTNSFLELTFGCNGFGRLIGDEAGSVGGGNGRGQTGIWRMFGPTSAARSRGSSRARSSSWSWDCGSAAVCRARTPVVPATSSGAAGSSSPD